MNAVETAEYMRDHYSREEYLLLTLTSCSLLLSNFVERSGDKAGAEVLLVEEILRNLRESMDEHELLSVSVMLAEIDRLRGDEDE
jgi:hypothetical protein